MLTFMPSIFSHIRAMEMKLGTFTSARDHLNACTIENIFRLMYVKHLGEKYICSPLASVQELLSVISYVDFTFNFCFINFLKRFTDLMLFLSPYSCGGYDT